MAVLDKIQLRKTDIYSSITGEVLRTKTANLIPNFDITIGDKTLCFHNFILFFFSPYMHNLFEMDAVTGIQFNHLDFNIMLCIRNYMYQRNISFPTNQLMGMIQTCKFLQMDELLNKCIDEIPAVLKSDNVYNWLKLGQKLNQIDIEKHCVVFMVTQFREFKYSAGFVELNYAELQGLVGCLLQYDHNTDLVLIAAINWIKCDIYERKAHLKELTQQIDLFKCSERALSGIKNIHGDLMECDHGVYESLLAAIEEVSRTLLLVGGQTNGRAVHECLNLQLAGKQIQKMGRLPDEKFKIYHSVCKTPTGFVITGRKYSNLCAEFDAATNSWLPLKNMPTKKHSHGSICVKGKLYVFRGFQAGIFKWSKSVHCFDMDHSKWQSATSLPIVVRHRPEVAELNGFVYLLDATSTNQLLQFDTEGQRWNFCAPLSGLSCKGCSMISFKDKLYIAGGENKRFAVYAPDKNEWSTLEPPNFVHTFGSLIYHCNKFLLIGGQTDNIE